MQEVADGIRIATSGDKSACTVFRLGIVRLINPSRWDRILPLFFVSRR